MRTRATRLLCLLAALLAPALAGAQTTGLTLVVRETASGSTGASGLSDGYINIGECAQTGIWATDRFSFSWDFSQVTSASNITSTTVYVDSASGCATNSSTRKSLAAATTSTPTNGTVGNLAPLTIMTTLSSGATCAAPVNNTLYFCAHGTDSAGNSVAIASGTVVIDFETPGRPTMTGATPGEAALNLSWSAGSGTISGYRVVTGIPPVAPAPPDYLPISVDLWTDVHAADLNNVSSYRMSGLVNNQPYWSYVFARSAGGNPGLLSGAILGTPQAVDDFWKHYRNAGGVEEGGCGGSAGLLALAALAPFVARLRRRTP